MKLIYDIFKYNNNEVISDLASELYNLYILNYFNNNNENIIVLTSTLYEANNIYKSLTYYSENVLFFPMDDFLTSVALTTSPDFKIKRLETLDILKENKSKNIVVTSLMGYLKHLPLKDSKTSIVVKINDVFSRDELIKMLDLLGYKRESIVTSTGEYAVRGYIIDIFPLYSENPIRLELFGDTIEKIKTFNVDTQMSKKEITEVTINSFEEIDTKEKSSLLDYVGDTVFIVNNNQIMGSYETLLTQIKEYSDSIKNVDFNFMFKYEDIIPKNKYYIDTLNSNIEDNKTQFSRDLINFNSNYDEFIKFCNNNKNNHTIIFASVSSIQRQKVKDYINDSVMTNLDNIYGNKVNIINCKLRKGFIYGNYIIITPNDLEKTYTHEIKYKNAIKVGRRIKSFNDLKIGDYIVHENNGIGIYNGLKVIKNAGIEKDYIELIYYDNDKVYIPVENIDVLYKYTDADGKVPVLSKLNNNNWEKKKTAVRKKIKDISSELLKLYSERSKILGPIFNDYDEEIKFGYDFEYNLTSDQEKAIKEINNELKSPVPMDKLLCGDVGFGKTEVAFRAMFKAVINGFQVSYLCPTTLLSKQQYNNAIERFKNFPIRIELINRHVSTKKINSIIKDTMDGKVDILIGTHMLLNSRISYKNLGLLIIDEEQRFGVSQKEKIKSLKNNINVLTLSATPIPRTLKMALSGLRSLSLLDTAPVNRYPIQTYVIEENDVIIKDAIYKELTRNGQVYILINNLEELYKFVNKLNILLPDIKIGIGHGRMDSNELSKTMEAFINNEFNVLVCTTIIETGIDIANVNTIIVIDSDKFGLSQLYQIRGRVGRSDRIAYAYLMYKPAKLLTNEATKRLTAIKDFTELGSGYKIAMRDLAIRGAGDLLGSEQAGFIDAVGIDLYTKMINEEISLLNGEETINESESNVVLNISTHIKDDIVQDENIKIEIHKMINSIKNIEDAKKIKSELIDRFGKIDNTIEIYILKKLIEEYSKKMGIKILQSKNEISVLFEEELSSKINGEKLFINIYRINPKFKIGYNMKKITIKLDIERLEKNYIYYIYELMLSISDNVY